MVLGDIIIFNGRCSTIKSQGLTKRLVYAIGSLKVIDEDIIIMIRKFNKWTRVRISLYDDVISLCRSDKKYMLKTFILPIRGVGDSMINFDIKCTSTGSITLENFS